MGLPAWSSYYVSNDKKTVSPKNDVAAARRSPIRRRSPQSSLSITTDALTGEISHLRRQQAARRSGGLPLPRAPVPRPLHRSAAHSPLVPVLPSVITRQLSDAQVALNQVVDEADQICFRDARSIVDSDPRRHLRRLFNHMLNCVDLYRSYTREELTHLEHWVLAFRRRAPSPAAQVEFFGEVQDIIALARTNLRTLIRMLRILRDSSEMRSNTTESETLAHSGMCLEIRGRPHRRSVDDSIAPVETAQPPPAEFRGLGDRTRSATPENDPDAWDNMRMTLEPDEQLPTADSSFTSAVASASFSVSSSSSRSASLADSANTSRTTLTIPELEENVCEFDDEAQDVPSIRLSDSQDRTEPTALPEVIPSPVVDRHVEQLSATRSTISSRPAQLQRSSILVEPQRREFWRGPVSQTQGLTQPPAQTRFAEWTHEYSFMPRSLSPLPLPDHQLNSLNVFLDRYREPSPMSHGEYHLDRPASRDVRLAVPLPVSPPPQSEPQTSRLTSTTRRSSAAVSSDIARFALRYGDRLVESSDPRLDPDLRRMRAMLQTMAEDGMQNMSDDEMWIRATLGSSIADNSNNQNNTHPARE